MTMNPVGYFRFWAVALAVLLFFSFPSWGQEQAPAAAKKSSQTKKKSVKSKSTVSTKKKKSSPTPKKTKRTPQTKKTPAVAPEVMPVAARPLSAAEGPIQTVVEQEIQFLKGSRRLQSGDEISVQVYDLAEKKMLVDIDGDMVRNAASLIKPFVMLAVYEQISRQELAETPGIHRQITRMIAVSDNHATNHLIRQVGGGDVEQGLALVNALMHKYGFYQTVVRELIPEGGKTYYNRTSAADTTAFFKLLYEQRLISPQYSLKMNDILLKNVHDRIETTLIKHDGVAVADKTGYVRGLNADCGIVYGGHPNGQGHDYILSIFIENKTRPADGSWGKRKTAVIRYLSDRIYHNLRNCAVKSYGKKMEEGRGKREATAALHKS
jgi:beta-lactamase class A